MRVTCVLPLFLAAAALAQPPAPSILTPGAGEVLTSTVVTFSWTASTGAERYELLIIDTATQRRFSVALLAGNLSAVYTLAGGTYQMQLAACTGTTCSAAATRNFSTPVGGVPATAPQNLTCALANDNNQNRLNCSWQAVTGSHFYFIHVIQQGAGPGGGALTVAGFQAGTTSASLLVPNGQATAIVRGCTGDGCGPFSAGFNFNATIGTPSVPVLGEPAQGQLVDTPTAPRVSFSWNRVAGDNGSNFRYRLYVQDFSRNQAALDVMTDSNFYSAFFNPGTRYDALVIAVPTDGSAPRQGPPNAFLTRGIYPRSPQVIAPTYDEAVTRDASGRVRLAWTPVFEQDGILRPRKYQYFLQGPTTVEGSSFETAVDVPVSVGTWLGAIRACKLPNNDAQCRTNVDADWHPWSNVSGSEGGQALFRVFGTVVPGTRVRFNTTLGNIDAVLLPEWAPGTVDNFVNYVRRGSYTDTLLHRSVPNFVIQSGGFRLLNGIPVTIPVDPSIRNEFRISNVRGTIGMAKPAGDPHGANSQYYFNTVNNSTQLDSENGGFTVFARVTDAAGLAIMDQIAAVPIFNGGSPFDSLPLRNYTSGSPITPANYLFVNSITIIPPTQ